MRAREPDLAGHVVRGGVRLHYEVHGSGPVTVFLMPTWCAIDARSWKMQVPYLARHARVVVADPRGNGRSDRPLDPIAYADPELVADAVAVLDETGTAAAVCVGLSMGARVLLQLATAHPDRVAGAVFVGPSVRMREVAPACWSPDSAFDGPVRSEDGWGRFNAEYWRRDLLGFARWFFGEVFTEEFSTKHVDDAVEWIGGTDAETLIAAERAPFLDREPTPGPTRATQLAARVGCPSLVVHGDEDRIVPLDTARLLAEALGAPLEVVTGGGHCVHARHPVWFNHRLLRFVEEVGAGARA